MRKKQKNPPHPKDNPATRKQRLQQRLQELSDKSERDLAVLIKTVDRMKATLKPKKTRS